MKLQVIICSLIGLSLVACSPSATQLKKVLQENPDVLHAAIEADPKGFFDTVQKVQGKAREQSMSQQMDDELKRVQEEMKNPKQVSIDENRAMHGSASALVTIVEWADFNCGHCGTASATMTKIAEEYGDKVRIVFKHLPILAPESKLAAEYMEAIGLQDKSKAWKFHKEVFAAQGEFRQGKEKFLQKVAKDVGADLGKLKKDLKSAEVKKRIESDIAEAQKFEFQGTPGFMVNGAAIYGALPYEFFKKVVDAVISSQPKS